MATRELPENLQARVPEETKREVKDLCWEYRLNESEATRRLVHAALRELDAEEVFGSVEERREIEAEAD